MADGVATQGPLGRGTVVIGLVSAVAAPLTLTRTEFVAMFLAGAFVGAFAAMLVRSVSELQALDSRESLVGALRSAEVGAVLAVATGVVVGGLGSYGWGIVLACMVGYVALRVVLRRPGSAPAPTSDDPDPATLRPTLRPSLWTPPFDDCSTSELAAAWGATYDLLGSTSSPLMRARIAELRAEYLDELERRDRAGVQRWLASGTQAASDLARFLRHRD